MRIRITAVVGMLALAAAFAACDGDDGDDGGTAGEEGVLTKSEFVQQADEVCADFTDDGSLEVNERLIGRVDDLVPPESEQDTVTRLLDEWREYFDQGSEPAGATANDIAHQLGLKCIIDI